MTVANRTIDLTMFNGSNVSEPYEVPETFDILSDGETVDYKSKGIFRVMTPQDGDKRIVWDRLNLPDITAAKNLFIDLIKQGLTPYRVGLDGKQTSEIMEEFDPSAEEVIFLPRAAIVGG